jgi:hypothetical protein
MEPAMSTIFLDSFEHYQITDITKKWSTAGGGIALSGGARTGSLCLDLSNTDGTTTLNVVDPLTNYVGIGFAMKMPSAAAGTVQIARIHFSTNTHTYSLQIDTSGNLIVAQGSDGSSPYGPDTTIDLDDNEWHYIEFWAANQSVTTTSYFKVWIDGTASSTLTVGTANDIVVSQTAVVTLQGPLAAASVLFDDVYIWEGALADDTRVSLGDINVHALMPNGNGAFTEWTPLAGQNFAAVDETDPDSDFPDDDTTYVEASASGNRDLYTFDDPSASDEPEWLVLQHSMWAKNSGDAGTLGLRAIANDGGVVDLSTTQDADLNTQTTYKYFRTVITAGINKSLTSLETQEFGMEVQ